MDENTILRNEIDRLNSIINVLLEHIEAIKLNNALSSFGNMPPDDKSTVVGNEKATPERWSTITENGIGTTENFSTIRENEKATPQALSTITEIGKGTPVSMSTVAETDNGITPVSAGKVKTLPEQITPGGQNFNKLYIALRPLFPLRVKSSKITSATNLMIYLHNCRSASGAEMLKVSGLSKPGYAKQYPSFERMGLIRKQPPHKYVLTEKSKGILLGVFGVEN